MSDIEQLRDASGRTTCSTEWLLLCQIKTWTDWLNEYHVYSCELPIFAWDLESDLKYAIGEARKDLDELERRINAALEWRKANK